MSHEPYDQEAHAEFDKIVNPYGVPYDDQPPHRHTGGRTMTRPASTAEDKKAQAWQMMGCSSLILALGIAVAVVVAAWRW